MSIFPRTTDYLIVGGGVIGINLALQARRRHPDARVILIEKESLVGQHASGRNSGVLHAGFYYTADSLKARFTREGNRLLTQYCEDKGISLNRCGKLVVAQHPSELETLHGLSQRALKNKVELTVISEREAKEIEPRVKTCEKALWSPTTSSVDPVNVMNCLLQDAVDEGVSVFPSTKYMGWEANNIVTSCGKIAAGYVINAAGLYADKIARDFGFSQNHTIVPFKGLYMYSNEEPGALRTNIYPVPDLKNPFLGVHYTITADYKIKIGPTAIPAFWRENYRGLDNFSFNECMEILGTEIPLFVKNTFGFRQLAYDELLKQFKSVMVKKATKLITGAHKCNYNKWGKPGIRAQLIDTRQGKLEMDFKWEGDKKSFHVLNAVSPAFTCSMPFSAYLFDKIDSLCGKK